MGTIKRGCKTNGAEEIDFSGRGVPLKTRTDYEVSVTCSYSSVTHIDGRTVTFINGKPTGSPRDASRASPGSKPVATGKTTTFDADSMARLERLREDTESFLLPRRPGKKVKR